MSVKPGKRFLQMTTIQYNNELYYLMQEKKWCLCALYTLIYFKFCSYEIQK